MSILTYHLHSIQGKQGQKGRSFVESTGNLKGGKDGIKGPRGELGIKGDKGDIGPRGFASRDDGGIVSADLKSN